MCVYKLEKIERLSFHLEVKEQKQKTTFYLQNFQETIVIKNKSVLCLEKYFS